MMQDSSTLPNRFSTSKVVGTGRHRSVAVAYDRKIRKQVFIKLWSFNSDDRVQAEGEFQREMYVYTQLVHPNIVRMFDTGETANSFFIVTEYMDSGSLAQRLREKEFLPLQEALTILRAAANGLEFAHEKGFVHGDLKPSHILFSSDGRVAISDFGLTRAVGVSVSTKVIGDMMGTAEFISPEQLTGESFSSPAIDVYALGVIAYQMLTGKLPFKGETPLVTLHMKISQEPPAPRKFNPSITKLIEKVLLRAIARNPKERYTSIIAFMTALESAVQNQPSMYDESSDLKKLVKSESVKTIFVIISGLIVTIVAAIILYYVFGLPH